DLNRSRWIQHSIQDRISKRPAVMETFSFIWATRVAMRINMDHSNGCFSTNGFEDWVGYRMVATNSYRYDASLHDHFNKRLNVGMAGRQIETAPERNIAYVGNLHLIDRRTVKGIVVRSNPFYGS